MCSRIGTDVKEQVWARSMNSIKPVPRSLQRTAYPVEPLNDCHTDRQIPKVRIRRLRRLPSTQGASPPRNCLTTRRRKGQRNRGKRATRRACRDSRKRRRRHGHGTRRSRRAQRRVRRERRRRQRIRRMQQRLRDSLWPPRGRTMRRKMDKRSRRCLRRRTASTATAPDV